MPNLNKQLHKTKTASQITKDTPSSTPIIISLELSPLIFCQTGIIFLYAHPHAVYMYDDYVKFYRYQFIHLGVVWLTRNMNRLTRQGDPHVPPPQKTLFAGVYKNCIKLQIHTLN